MILVCLDTVRRDAIESVDGQPPAMPALAALAERSTHFVDASSSAAWTAPSVTTLLTGLLPPRHGVRGPLGSHNLRLSPAVPTLAEYLKSAGYETAACTGGGYVSQATNLSQGFDTFEQVWMLPDSTGALERWLARRDRSRPFFLFLHTYDAHDPYGEKPPKPTAEQAKRLRALVDELRAHREKTGTFPPERMREVMIAFRSDPLTNFGLSKQFDSKTVMSAIVRYDREVFPTSPEREETAAILRSRYRDGLRITDDRLGKALARLDREGVAGSSILIVTTDHGEAFGEHDNLGHGRWLHDELVRAIVAVRAPGRTKVGPVRGSCGVVDVVPTVLDLVGLPLPDTLDGRSLLPLARGDAPGHAVLAEEHRMIHEEGRRVGLQVVAARTERAKWMGTWDPRTRALTEAVYDLVADPGERRPLPADAVARFGPALEDGVRRGREMAKRFGEDPDAPGDDAGFEGAR